VDPNSSRMKHMLWAGLAAVMVLGMFSPAQAEERVLEIGKWYPTLESGLTLTQSTYTDNWAGGDKGSIVWTFITNATLENQLSTKVNWNSTLKLAYGQTHQQSADTLGERSWAKPEKSTDLVDLETMFRFTLGGLVDPFAAGRLETQFQDASDVAGRNLSFNPIRVKLTAGVARQFINEEDRSLLSRLGFAVRQTSRKIFTTEDSSNKTTQSVSSTDGGLEWVTDYKTKVLSDRVAWTSKLTVYQPLFYSDQGLFDDLTANQISTNKLDPDIADYTMTADIDWENIFTTQITKLLSVNLYLRFIYDKYDNSVPVVLDGETLTNAGGVRAAVRKGLQIKETLALGITYRFL